MNLFTTFFGRIIGTFGLHFTYLAIILSAFIFFGYSDHFPYPKDLNFWDIAWYRTIAENGYQFTENQQSNVAFFPLFPYLWKFTHMNPRGISLLNTGLFLSGLAFLAREFKISMKYVLLFLSFPSIIFMYVPYTEACFFLFSTILLIGLHRRSTLLIITGLFLCCITRSATLLFFPAIIFMEWMDTTDEKNNSHKLINIILYLATALFSLLVVAYIQWAQTGQWFSFYGVHKYWNQFLHLPALPLTTWGGYKLLWLDGVAIWVGLAASAFCTYILYRWLTSRPVQLLFNNRPLIFAAGYLVGAFLFVLFYQGGSVILNRYIFATPYFMLFFICYIKTKPFKTKALIIITILTSILWFAFGAYKPLDAMDQLQTIWYFTIITLYILSCLLINHPRIGGYAIAGVYSLNIILQLAMLNTFLGGYWVG